MFVCFHNRDSFCKQMSFELDSVETGDWTGQRFVCHDSQPYLEGLLADGSRKASVVQDEGHH